MVAEVKTRGDSYTKVPGIGSPKILKGIKVSASVEVKHDYIFCKLKMRAVLWRGWGGGGLGEAVDFNANKLPSFDN